MTTTLVGLLLFPTFGIWEMVIIGLVLVLLFGATKLPKLGKGLGEGIRNFKSGLTGSKEKNNKEEQNSEIAQAAEEADK